MEVPRKSKPIVADGACDLDEEELDPKSVVVDDPIVGEELITLDENGPGVLTPKAIPAPKEMSTMERERHFTNGTFYKFFNAWENVVLVGSAFELSELVCNLLSDALLQLLLLPLSPSM